MMTTYSYEQITDWMDRYFEGVNRNQGSIEQVAKSRKYFSKDLEFWMYTAPPVDSTIWHEPPNNRDELLLMFVHPGLEEGLVPHFYVIDTKKLMVVVQFELRFRDTVQGCDFAPLQASAIYQLAEEAGDLAIKKIQYWIQTAPPGQERVLEMWLRARHQALAEFAVKHLPSLA